MIKYVDSIGTALTGSENHGFTLQHDSIIQINPDTNYLIANISTGIEKNQTYNFQNDEGVELKLKRLNYTDLEVTVIDKTDSYESTASMTLDVLNKKVVNIDSTDIQAHSFNMKVKDCSCILLLSKQEKNQNESRFTIIHIKENSCDQLKLERINGLYKEK